MRETSLLVWLSRLLARLLAHSLSLDGMGRLDGRLVSCPLLDPATPPLLPLHLLYSRRGLVVDASNGGGGGSEAAKHIGT